MLQDSVLCRVRGVFMSTLNTTPFHDVIKRGKLRLYTPLSVCTYLPHSLTSLVIVFILNYVCVRDALLKEKEMQKTLS